MPKLVIDVPSAPPEVRIILDGQDVTVAKGTELPVDLGAHTVVVSAPGHVTRETTTSITDEGKTIALAITLEPAAAPEPTTSPEPSPPTTDVPKAPTPAAPPPSVTAAPVATPAVVVIRDERDSSPGRGRKILGVMTMLLGGGAVGIGLHFGNQARGAWDEAKLICGDDLRCDTAAQHNMASGFHMEAKTQADKATWFTIGGAVTIAGGLLLVLTAPSGSARSASGVRLEPGVGGSPTGVTFSGSF